MFGIGLPEMIVILAVALIVVGPDKLPDLARSLAKGVFELKKTLNQVKASLADEEDLLGSVRSDLHKAAGELKGSIADAEHFQLPETKPTAGEAKLQDGDIIDVESEQLPAGDQEEHPRYPPADGKKAAAAEGDGSPDAEAPAAETKPPEPGT